MANGIEIIARGVWRAEASLLLCRNVAKGYFYLPGGHVEPGEAGAAALARELLEETGERRTIGEPLAIAECLFEQGGRARHEINLVFHVEHAGPPIPVQSREAEIAFEWVEAVRLKAIDLRPKCIKSWLIHRYGNDGRSGRAQPGLAWLSDT